MAAMVDGPRGGTRVTIYMPDEFETDAVLRRDDEAGISRIERGDAGIVRYRLCEKRSG